MLGVTGLNANHVCDGIRTLLPDLTSASVSRQPVGYHSQLFMATAKLAKTEKTITLSDVIAGCLVHNGIDRIYGAPGTTELSLLQSAARHNIRYLFATHDAVAVGMADGFSRYSRQTSVVNLHSVQGLLNASGFIRVALRDNSPVVVIAGIPSTAYDVYEPNHFLLNLQQCLTPITKWGWVVSNSMTIRHVLEKAVSIAQAPPQGPVFILIPQDLLETPVPASLASQPRRVFTPTELTIAAESYIQRAAKHLVRAKAPAIFAGYGSQDSADLLAELADKLAAPIIAEALDRGPQIQNVYCRTNHPLFVGFFDIRDEQIRQVLKCSDVLVMVGGKATYSKIIGELPRGCVVIQINTTLPEMWNYARADVPLVGHFGLILKQLCHQVKRHRPRVHLFEDFRTRKDALISEIRAHRRRKKEALADVVLSGTPIVGIQLVKAMTQTLPQDAIIVDDSQCMGYYIKHYYEFSSDQALYGSMASHIGWALPASLGIKEAARSRPVVALIGDGSFLFSLQALTTASIYNIPVLVIIANNRGYISLQKEVAVKGCLNSAISRDLSLNQAEFDYTMLAKSIGLDAVTVSDASAVAKAIRTGLACIRESKKAFVVNVLMSSNWEDWDEAWYVPPKTS